ncbi:MAG TPA: septal ring lytic transglycosylase RlpA family protein [Pseudolabrys sp.]|nr:septal ring lytic transglycosylase RlpA family protein [Pseudolabrys sp.]
MSPPALSSKRHQKSDDRPAQRGGLAIVFILALALFAGTVWGGIGDESSIVSVDFVQQSEHDSDVIVLSITDAEISAPTNVGGSAPDAAGIALSLPDTCPLETTGILALIELPADAGDLASFSVAPRATRGMLDTMGDKFASASGTGSNLVEYARRKMLPQFFSAYRSVFRLATLMGLPRTQDEATLAHITVVGVVSTYNPFRDRTQEGDAQTASGELYDPAAWTAAIQVDLRNQFGGVRYGRLYQPTYALVESGDKQLIVKINDVGSLKPGRVLDLNEKSMRHFDPFLSRGLLADVKITLLPGEDWTPGPVGSVYAIDFPTSEQRAAPALVGFAEPTDLDSGADLASGPHERMRSPSAGIQTQAEEAASEGG